MQTAAWSILRVNGAVSKCTVRYYARKPRWVPVAKSKMFKTIELPYRPLHEEEEITRLWSNYQVYSTSLMAYQERTGAVQFANNTSVTKEGTEVVEWDKIIAEVERDNTIVREIREKLLEKEWKDIESGILAQKVLLEEQALHAIQETEEELELQLIKLNDTIDHENLDDAIDKALDTEIDYNFAIDKENHIYNGRNNDLFENISVPCNLQNNKTEFSVTK